MKKMQEQIKQEAIERMKILKLHKRVIQEFEKEDKLNKSEGQLGELYYLDEKEQALVKEYERKNNVLVYHIIHTFSNLGETYELLYVTQEKEDWKDEKRDLKRSFATVKVIVINYQENSEIGVIGFESKNGGIIRVC